MLVIKHRTCVCLRIFWKKINCVPNVVVLWGQNRVSQFLVRIVYFVADLEAVNFSACKSATKYMIFVHFCKSSLGNANSSTESQSIVFTVQERIFRNTFEHRPELWESTQLVNRLTNWSSKLQGKYQRFQKIICSKA